MSYGPIDYPESRTCSCCGYRSMNESCTVCDWVEEFEDIEHPDEMVPLNFAPLREAQEHFRNFGYCSPTSDKPEFHRFQRDPNWQPLPPLFRGPVTDPDIGNAPKTCPCCGYMSVRVSMNSCPICGWVYSAQQEDPDRFGWPNGMTLRQGQAHFSEYGACGKHYLRLVRPPNDEDIRDPNWEPLDWKPLEPVMARNSFGGPVVVSEYKDHIKFDPTVLSEIPCPVCGYIARRRGVGRCPICLWDLYVGHRDELDQSKPNPVPVRQAQENFLELGMYRELPSTISYYSEHRVPTEQDRRNPDWRLLS